jgi:hypothetical protein
MYFDLGTLPLLSSTVRSIDSGNEMLIGIFRSIFTHVL